MTLQIPLFLTTELERERERERERETERGGRLALTGHPTTPAIASTELWLGSE